MKFTLSWLKEHLETDRARGEITDQLTRLGLELESVTDRAAALKPFTVAKVVACAPHPDASKLRLCTVDTGGEHLQVVCGAPNARAGIMVVLARPGVTIPATGDVLRTAKIRGIESHGMLCSARELGLGDDHDGIIELPADAPLGQPFAQVLGLDDPLIDVSVTPNRPDCLGVRGIARDLAAAGFGRLKPRKVEPVAGRFTSPVTVRFAFAPHAEKACPLFVGREIRGLRNGESPEWLKRRLTAIGLRPISALVDITNFFTFDIGRPLHVFDADTIAGGLTVRLARAGETLRALNGKDYVLDDEVCAIADDDSVLSLGGVMGGESSGVTEGTTRVFVESALFDPLRTAATGRRLGIDSDARYRFERGVDPASAVSGMEAATAMILDLCGGEPSALVIAGAEPVWQKQLTLRATRVHSLGGLDLPEDRIRRILESIGFACGVDGAALRVSVPSWRPDIEGEADLVEEVIRIAGYDSVPAVPLVRPTNLPQPALDPAQRRAGLVRRTLASRGIEESVTWSFLSSRVAPLFGGGQADLVLVNPISADLDVMRPSILPNLIAAAGRNAARGLADCALFEIGPQFTDDTRKGQSLVAAGLRAGRTGPRHWAEPSRNRAMRAVDAFDAKADALAALSAANAPVDKITVEAGAPNWYHPGRSGTLKLGPQTVLATFGEIHPRVLEALGVAGPVAGFEVHLDRVPMPKAKASRARSAFRPPAFQPVERDFAFVVGADVTAEAVLRAARNADKALIADAQMFDVYQGPGIEAGRKSIALSITLQPVERTLTDAEIEVVAQKIVKAVADATGAMLRQ